MRTSPRLNNENFSKRLVKQPKLYFLDAGLAAYLTGHLRWGRCPPLPSESRTVPDFRPRSDRMHPIVTPTPGIENHHFIQK